MNKMILNGSAKYKGFGYINYLWTSVIYLKLININ